MIELLVMRHAKSDWHAGESDFNRPLNDRGVRAADQMGAWLANNDLVPDRVLSSPAARAKATALAVVSACEMDSGDVSFVDDLYLADDYTWRQAIGAHGASTERLLICGHNPGLDDLVDYLSSTRPALTASGKLMTTAAIARFRFQGDWSALGERTGQLISLTRPRDIGAGN